MSRFIESICFAGGSYALLDLHQERVNKTFRHFFPGFKPLFLGEILPDLSFSQKYKVRLVYDQDSVDIEFSEYIPRKISSLEVVAGDHIEYSSKFEDRKALDNLVNYSTADDILISKNGRVTDSSYSNLAFWDGVNWYTPSEYLLNGVKRQYLIRQGTLTEIPVLLTDLKKYEAVSLINAMLDPGDVMIGIDSVIVRP